VFDLQFAYQQQLLLLLAHRQFARLFFLLDNFRLQILGVRPCYGRGGGERAGREKKKKQKKKRRRQQQRGRENEGGGVDGAKIKNKEMNH